jgi:hypothetical protein
MTLSLSTMPRGPQKRRKGATTPAEQTAARAFLEDVMKDFDGVGLHAAKKLGVSASTISQCRGPEATKPIGAEFAGVLARYRGVGVDEVYGRSKARSVYKPARYPNLERALEREGPEITEAIRADVFARARSLAMNYPTDRAVGEWEEELHSLARSIRRAQKTGDAITGRPYDEDDTPPG